MFFEFSERRALRTIINNTEKIMATMQQVLDDLDTIKVNALDYVAKRDAIDVQKDADLAAALAKVPGIPADVQAQIDAAFAKAEEDKAQLAPVVPPVVEAPPVTEG